MILASAILSLAPQALPIGGGSIELEYKTYRKWDIVLPAEQFARVSGGFSSVSCSGESFGAELDGTALVVDTDGDGTPDVRVAGKKDDATGERSAMVTLTGTGTDGKPFQYAARLVDSGKGWHFAASGAQVGKIGETKVRLIDQNNDGRYDGFGQDAMTIGRSKFATFLSRAVNVGGVLYQIDVAPDGSRIDFEPYTGEVGVLDLASGLETDGKLLSAVVRSADRQFSFDLASFKKGIRVPAQTYSLHSGKLGLGKSVAYVKPGRLGEIDVTGGERTSLAWGGPVKAEFRYARNGGQVVIRPDDVTYFGKAGEEYRVWDPVGKSPEFTIKELKAGTELAKAMFPGSS
ncbi:MAG: hypothetical protein GY711_08290 [bacterium]|nr:hypothetical protein [bacterium]